MAVLTLQISDTDSAFYKSYIITKRIVNVMWRFYDNLVLTG